MRRFKFFAADPGAGGTPGQAAPGEQKPGEQKPGEQQPGEQKPGEQKPGEEKPGEQKPAEQNPGEQKPGEQKPGEQQPPKYELKLPANNRHVDQADVDAFLEIAKAEGMTPEQAQAALDKHASSMAAQGERFLTELKSHPEVGGEKLAVAQQRANAVLDKFLPPDSPEGKALRSGFNKGGYDNWTPLVLLFSRIGAAMGEDALRLGAAAAPGGGQTVKPTADVLFPSTVKS